MTARRQRLSGVPDLILIHGGKIFALELKAAPGRNPTPAQIETMRAMRSAGANVAVAYGLDQAIAQLEAWHLLRPDRNNPERTRAVSASAGNSLAAINLQPKESENETR